MHKFFEIVGIITTSIVALIVSAVGALLLYIKIFDMIDDYKEKKKQKTRLKEREI